jgi:hypothetical protein
MFADRYRSIDNIRMINNVIILSCQKEEKKNDLLLDQSMIVMFSIRYEFNQ